MASATLKCTVQSLVQSPVSRHDPSLLCTSSLFTGESGGGGKRLTYTETFLTHRSRSPTTSTGEPQRNKTTSGRKKKRGNTQELPLLEMSLPTASPYIQNLLTNQLPDRAPLLLAFCFHPFAVVTSGIPVSSVGAAGVSPHPVTPWPQRTAAGWEAGGGGLPSTQQGRHQSLLLLNHSDKQTPGARRPSGAAPFPIPSTGTLILLSNPALTVITPPLSHTKSLCWDKRA